MALEIILSEKIYTKDHEGVETEFPLSLLARFGPLGVTGDCNIAVFGYPWGVTHLDSTLRIIGFETFDLACRAARLWSTFDCWDIPAPYRISNRAHFYAVRRIQKLLEATPIYKKGRR